MTSAATNLCGLLVLDKPAGISSMQAVAIVRGRASGVKTGHAGTLDPLATGVLVIAVGRATKLVPRLMDTRKRYLTEIDLSAFTATDDLEGEREEVDVLRGGSMALAVQGGEGETRDRPPTREEIERVVRERFTGEFLQAPPVFSAVKVGGRRAYKLARKGQALEMPPRRVMVYANEVVAYNWPMVTLRVHCAKGFYVRSLARALGVALGTGGHCQSIRRTAVGPFTLEMARQVEQLPPMIGAGDLISPEAIEVMLAGDGAAR